MGKHCTAAAAASPVCHIHLKTRASLNNSNNNHNCHDNIFWCEDPIVIAKFLLLLLLQNELHFEGLNMLENSWNFAHTPEVVNIYIWYVFQKWVWHNASIAPPIKSNEVPLELFHIHVRNSVGTCTHQYLQKFTLVRNPKPNRKSGI